jgi:hypothetical protein
VRPRYLGRPTRAERESGFGFFGPRAGGSKAGRPERAFGPPGEKVSHFFFFFSSFFSLFTCFQTIPNKIFQAKSK